MDTRDQKRPAVPMTVSKPPAAASEIKEKPAEAKPPAEVEPHESGYGFGV